MHDDYLIDLLDLPGKKLVRVWVSADTIAETGDDCEPIQNAIENAFYQHSLIEISREFVGGIADDDLRVYLEFGIADLR